VKLLSFFLSICYIIFLCITKIFDFRYQTQEFQIWAEHEESNNEETKLVFVLFVLLLLTFLVMFDHLLYSKKLKIIIYFCYDLFYH
jgi:hypothetical protein